MQNLDFDYLTSPNLEPVFWTPERLGRASAWWGHVPFAFWLIANSEPRLLVELGTHYGVSYAAFCEAILRLRLPTRCYAVDTWQGDPHAGAYGEDVYSDLKEFHDKRYAFSQLVRRTFDQASGDFADGSIDLLHIDGFHTYEAVRHDFETWRPKLSDRAVALFHDTNERQGDFGVWRLLEELKHEAPTFEFLHEHGLGIVAVGAKAPAAMQRLCALTDGPQIAVVRERFSFLGARWIATKENSDLDAHARALAEVVAQKDAHAHALKVAVAQNEARARALEEALAQKDAHGHPLKVAVAQSEARARALEEALAQKDTHGHPLKVAVAQSEARARALEEALAQKDARACALEVEIQQRSSQIIDLRSVMSKAQQQNDGFRRQVQRLERDLEESRQTASMVSDTLTRSNEDIVRLLAVFNRNDFNGGALRQLTGSRWWGFGRWKKWRRLARDYHAVASSPLFDPQWYLERNPDVAINSKDPALHYLLHGAREGRAPGPRFDGSAYLQANPDVANSKTNPLLHFIRHGRNENRRSNVVANGCRKPITSGQTEQVSIAVRPETGSLNGTTPLGPELARSIDIDHSLAAPFGYVVKPRAAPGRVAAILHIYYDDLSVELRSYLRNIPGEVDVFIATADVDRKLAIESAFAGWAAGTVEVRVVPNRGRDIAPKLIGFRDVHDRYDFVLHLHGKRSDYAPNWKHWRHYLLESSRGNPAGHQQHFRSIRAQFTPRNGGGSAF